MTKAVFGLANNDEQARRIVDRLLANGFSNEDISILYPDRTEGGAHTGNLRDRENLEFDRTSEKPLKKGKISTEKNTKAPEGGVTGAVVGGLLGGSLGLLAGIGALAIPGVGPFIAAGPLMAALGGSALGGSTGLLIGALAGAGIPEYEAKKYEDALKKGQILISVHTESSEEITRAQDIMKNEGAHDIATSRETTKQR